MNIKASGSCELFEIKSIDEKTLEVVAVGENDLKTERIFSIFDLKTIDTKPAVQENIVARMQIIEEKLGI